MRSDSEARQLHNEGKTHPPQSSVLELSLRAMNAFLGFKSVSATQRPPAERVWYWAEIQSFLSHGCSVVRSAFC